MTKIERVMRRRPLSVRRGELRSRAARRVGRRGLRCVPVVDGGRVVGVVTYADLADDAADGVVEERMRPAVCLEWDERTREALARVGTEGECLPVLASGRLVGVTSAHDLRSVLRAEAVEAILD